MSEKQKLKQIFTSIYDKVRKLQNDNLLDKAVEREASKTYVGMNDDYFFKQMCDLIFQSGLRGQVWQKYESEIRKEFGDYKVELVAKYTQKHAERMLRNPKMLKHRKKIDAVIHNAKELLVISEDYKGFWQFLEKQNIQELVEKLKSRMKWMGYANAYAFLRYVGMEVIKPDLNVVRVLFRLGLIDSTKSSPQIYARIQKVGKEMAKANNVKMAVIDYTLYQFGAGEKPFLKYAICSKVPKCGECPINQYCLYEGVIASSV